MWQIKRLSLQADGGAGGVDSMSATQGNQSVGVDDKAIECNSVEFTAEQQSKIQELISKAFAKGAAKAGKDASKSAEDKIAELEGKLAQAECEKQVAATAAVMSAKGLLFSGENSDINNATLARILTGKDKDESDGNVALLERLLEARVQAGVDSRLRAGGTTPPPATGNNAVSINDKIRSALKGV